MSVNAKAPQKALSDITNTYILDYQDYYGTFTASTSFTIEAQSGTVNVFDPETDEDKLSFEYNVVLNDFTYEGAVVYGNYDETDGTIYIPVQTISTNSTYGRIVLGGVTKDQAGTPQHIALDMILEVDGSNLYLYSLEDELAAAGLTGEYMSGWYSFLPDYAQGGAWNFGYDIEFMLPNARLTCDECHVSGGAWTDWAEGAYNVAVEDLGTELYVHNFLNLAPISIVVDGYDYRIPIPQQLDSYDWNQGEGTPDYTHLWSMDADGNPREDGYISGKAYLTNDGQQVIRFCKEEYHAEPWTDSAGAEREPGLYFTMDREHYFMVSSTFGEEGAYWYNGGEYIWVDILVSDDIQLNIEPTGILAPKATETTKSSTLYDLQGRVVDGSYKGIVISNGKKVVVK